MRKVPLNKSISPQTLGRLTYLAVYLTYEDDNRLMLTERQPMFRQDLPQVLGLPERTVDRFVKEAKNSGVLIVDKYGQLFMDDNIFFRGKTKRRKKMRLYRKPIQQLYQKMSRNYDHYFGYVIALDKLINATGNSNLCFKPLFPALEAELCIVWKKYQVLSRASNTFLQQLQQELENL